MKHPVLFMIEIVNGTKLIASGYHTGQVSDKNLQQTVAEIIQNVIQGGDSSLLEYTEKFDGVRPDHLRVPEHVIKDAAGAMDENTRSILTQAADNIRSFHQKQLAESWEERKEDGTVLGQKVTALDSAGVYIPGGRAFYPSTLLMNVIPAQIAGVERIVVVSPPGKSGYPHELVLACCELLGVYEVYSVGGAQAVGALAYGTETIGSVCKITGPGNMYVTEAKRQVFGQVGIDSVAGPSEILILHDDPSVPVEYLVRDMLSQAEHDMEATSILITTHKETALAVQKRLADLVPTLPRKEIIEQSIKNNGKIVLVDRIEEGIELCNQIAPEHLEVLFTDESKMDLIKNAGAIFIGQWSSEPIGDYFAGPNHTIPTSGAARYSSPLGTQDFQKHSSIIRYSEERVKKEGESIARFADMEDLHAHAAAVRVRMRNL